MNFNPVLQSFKYGVSQLKSWSTEPILTVLRSSSTTSDWNCFY